MKFVSRNLPMKVARIWKGTQRVHSRLLVVSVLITSCKMGSCRAVILDEALTKISRSERSLQSTCSQCIPCRGWQLTPSNFIRWQAITALSKKPERTRRRNTCKLCIGLGGSITGEHGVGMEKREYMGEMFSDG